MTLPPRDGWGDRVFEHRNPVRVEGMRIGCGGLTHEIADLILGLKV
jgi:hypothetical protein